MCIINVHVLSILYVSFFSFLFWYLGEEFISVLRHLFSDPYVCTIVITHAIYSINIVYTKGHQFLILIRHLTCCSIKLLSVIEEINIYVKRKIFIVIWDILIIADMINGQYICTGQRSHEFIKIHKIVDWLMSVY